MKINPKFVQKYGSKDEVLLPPPPESEEEVELELPIDKDVPVIEEPSAEESARFFNIRYNPEDSPRLQRRIENQKKIEESNMYSSPEEKGGDNPTLPGGKKRENEYPTYTSVASSKHDLLLSSCETYLQLASKLK